LFKTKSEFKSIAIKPHSADLVGRLVCLAAFAPAFVIAVFIALVET
jgi:hypothetical protein